MVREVQNKTEGGKMIERAKKMAEQNAGYHYDESVLVQICNAGFDAVPNGVTLTTAGDQTLTLDAGAVVCTKAGVETKRTPVNTESMREQVVIMYAVSASKLATQMGI